MGATTRESMDTTFHPGVDSPPRAGRLTSLDVTRGIVMILMAIDHVRVYAGVPAGGLPASVFFTRWVTHFVAPGFAFLAGTGAFLHAQKLGDRRALARFLVARGIVLVLLELTVIRVSWTFNLDFAHYNLAGVIWMLGWCMILLAGLIWLPTTAIGAVGLLIIFAQNVFTPIGGALPGPIGQFLYLGGVARLGPSGPPIGILYVLVPWIGVMAAGYAFGAVMTREPNERRRLCLRIGLTATAAFIVVAGAMTLLRPPTDGAPPALFRMLNQRKYPASALFLLMTLGPTIAFLSLAERMRGPISRFLSTFGRVPLFYYLLHVPLIHALAIGVSLVREGHVNPWLFGNHPFDPPPVPPGYRWSLWLLYLVFAIAIALLYVPCRWYAGVKARSRSRWLSYL